MRTLGRWLEGLLSGERRQAQRIRPLSLVAYYWDGATPASHSVRDTSTTGLYILTEQRWYPGTLVTMTLQRKDASDTDSDRSIMIKGRVVRSDVDGVGFEFVLPHKQVRSREADMKTLNRFLRRLPENQGCSLQVQTESIGFQHLTQCQ